ncbi:MAG: hypothetical protein K8S98_18900 [Planctomycetes bacterium]|nr:hypothetical protein [Planctomycetota bacterium]
MKHKTLYVNGLLALGLGTTVALATAMQPPPALDKGADIQLSIAKIYWEYNASANDLGVHVSLDGEDWKELKIHRPDNKTIFEVRGKGAYKELGMTELFFEGAEPSLDEFPLMALLKAFPQGEYEIEGTTVDGSDIGADVMFSHAIPDGPEVFSQLGANDLLRISWNPVTAPPPGFPNLPITIAGYQVIVGSFQVTLPATATSVTVPPEFVASLAPGAQPFEVLAIEQNNNQTLTEGTFFK